MLLFFICSVVVSLSLSFFCSLIETTLYAVPLPYLRHKAQEEKSVSAQIMLNLKRDMSKSIAAVLIINTASNTAGSAIAGWAAAETFGSHALAIFSVLFTLAVLYISEIIPKFLGVVHCRSIALIIARPLALLIKLLFPLIWVSEHISKLFNKGSINSLTTEEILSIASAATEDGALDHLEGSVISNVIGLDETLVKDVLTPRIVVFRLDEDSLISDIAGEMQNWTFTRIPLYADHDPDHLNSYVIQRDIFSALLAGKQDITLKQLARPLKIVPELMRVDKLLLQMFAEREQICTVVDEHGGLAGIITLEDIIEEIVGREIVDEYDSVSDLRTFAKLLSYTRAKN